MSNEKEAKQEKKKHHNNVHLRKEGSDKDAKLPSFTVGKKQWRQEFDSIFGKAVSSVTISAGIVTIECTDETKRNEVYAKFLDVLQHGGNTEEIQKDKHNKTIFHITNKATFLNAMYQLSEQESDSESEPDEETPVSSRPASPHQNNHRVPARSRQ